MIISLAELKSLIDVGDFTNDRLAMILKGLETEIRRLTNNHFHVKNLTFILKVLDGQLVGSFHHLSVGDTIEVIDSEYNGNRVACITGIDDSTISLDSPLENETEFVTIRKVVYPDDVIQGVINLVDWETKYRDKVGIKSETLSRHTVTYAESGEKQINGYPATLFNFLKPYYKARF